MNSIKTLLITFGFLIWFAPINIFAQKESLSDHVILISIDGFRPEFYEDKEWPLPNIKDLKKNGISATGVRSVYPSVTYPSHTTIITGAYPAKHGIYYNTRFDYNKPTEKWYWEYDLIQVPTLWDAVNKKGLTSASFIWPVSVGAPVTYNIPEVWTLEKDYGRIEPMRDNEKPDGFLNELERAVTGKLNERTFNGDDLNREDRTGEMAAYVLETYKPNFMSIHLIAADHFQHEQGRKGDKVFLAMGAIDRAIGKIREAAARAGIAERTTFIITGDHGFVNIHGALKPNKWLAELGLIKEGKPRSESKAYFNTSGAAAFLHMKDPKDKETLQQITKKLNDLPRSIGGLFRIIDRKKMDEVGADPNAVLALDPVPGVAMSGGIDGEVFISRSGGTHGYFPDFDQIETGFIISGSGVNPKNKTIGKLSLADIAPLIATLLDLDFTAPDGIYHPGILKDHKENNNH